MVDVAQLIEENINLRARLDTLPTIEQSKGILMLRYQIDAETAFSLLRRWSSHTNIKLRHLSRLLVDAATRDARSHTSGRGRPSGLRWKRSWLGWTTAAIHRGWREDPSSMTPVGRPGLLPYRSGDG